MVFPILQTTNKLYVFRLPTNPGIEYTIILENYSLNSKFFLILYGTVETGLF